MFSELWWLIKKVFSKIKQAEGLTYKLMKHFPFKGYSAMCWCGYLVTREDRNTINNNVILHEIIHLKLAIAKYKDKRWYRFYLSYFWWYIKGFTLLLLNSAYYTIPYEMEAYANLDNLEYKITKNSYKKYIIGNRRTTYKKHKNNWILYLKSI